MSRTSNQRVRGISTAVIRILFLLAYPVLIFTPSLEAAIVLKDDIYPELPWDDYTYVCIGNTSDGSLKVDEGSLLRVGSSCIGNMAGVNGTVLITGSGSKWANSESLYVGRSGNGMLTVESGGEVVNANGYVGDLPGSVGMAIIRGNGSIWSNTINLHVGNNGNGTLIIEDRAQVSSLYGNVGAGYGSTGTAIVTGAGSTWDCGVLHLGLYGNGTLIIKDGAMIINGGGYLGYSSGTRGTATVTGAGSKWLSGGALNVGLRGGGNLTIENGGEVSNSNAYVGLNSDSSGSVMVMGSGSKWINGSGLFVGYNSTSNNSLHIRDGGYVETTSLSINASSQLSIDVGYDSQFRVIGTMTKITNNGTVRILAGPGPMAGGPISPIVTVGAWIGSGSYQALGGTWNNATHAFTVSPTLDGDSGIPVAVDLADQQRVLVNDGPSGGEVGASFLAKTGAGTDILFTATVVGNDGLADLRSAIGSGQPILSAWDFSASGAGYSPTDPVYLSFAIGEAYTRSGVQLWQYDGAAWKSYSADDLSCQDGYASFTVAGLSRYAISAVPEPSTMVLLVTCAAGGIVAMRRRLWRRANLRSVGIA